MHALNPYKQAGSFLIYFQLKVPELSDYCTLNTKPAFPIIVKKEQLQCNFGNIQLVFFSPWLGTDK